MDINKAVKVLELLAAGYSPATGAMISNESVLNERDVIRALQIAIDYLKEGSAENPLNMEIPEEDIGGPIQTCLGKLHYEWSELLVYPLISRIHDTSSS